MIRTRNGSDGYMIALFRKAKTVFIQLCPVRNARETTGTTKLRVLNT